MPNSSLLEKFFFHQPAGTFALGRVVAAAALETDFEQYVESGDVGRWHCDLANHDALTWSDRVYEIFGLPHGAPVAREQAVARYRSHSRAVLERLRAYAIGRKCGFILDAEISPRDDRSHWIRILAAPLLDQGRVIGIHGLKRVL